ncbi:larval cuticle protein LCP-30-like isoform X2 [Teleopsis dalmanni]|uniref:larval cuticle protein LCP-30-like isoform X2 n=1 Tax=Teleopsis dalmanni TaxID=139649 RepID=UPI0018CE610E|nr:larval cuticle protein LCP-30-like isoform X2 [Teleopsis dalmanni]
MFRKVLLFVTIVAVIAVCRGVPVDSNSNQYNNYNNYNNQNYGKYQVSNENANDGKYHANNDGRYRPSQNEGRYIQSTQPYRHVHDNRELGFYVHVPYPYDGGYGPYSGSNIPYVHDDRPYDHNLYTTTTTKKPTTTTKRTTTTTTTTTTTPRNILFNYDDEGRHKILHQEDARKHDKYDHAYLTENGIYGEEQAKLHHEGGTHAKGYYEYTGDDGKLYRVNYKSNHEGFMPMGEHIPTPPPIPEAIARALKWVDEKRKANGEMPMFDERGFRIDKMMTKDIMAKIKSIHVEDMPAEIGEKIRELQREMELEERKQQEWERTHYESETDAAVTDRQYYDDATEQYYG